MSGAEALSITNLSAGYPRRPVIRDLSLPPLKPGEVVSLVGPNAAGKSTLLRALSGLLPASGSIRLGDRELIGLPLKETAKSVVYMPQTLPQGVALGVLETVVGALRASAVQDRVAGDDEAAARAIEVLEQIGIAHLAMEGLDRLSGGQKQLTALAQALVRAPRVLLLDEPTSALDLRYQLRVLKLVRRLAAERRMVVVMVLHDLQAAAQHSDQIVMLAGGAIHAVGTPQAAITAETLAQVYQVQARVDLCERGTLRIMVDDVL